MSDSDTDSEVEQNIDVRTLRRIECGNYMSNSLKGSQCSTSSNVSLATNSTEADRSAESYKIDVALALNKQCDEKLQRLEKVLESRLIECRDKLKKVSGQNVEDNDRRESFRYINCGRPYFKDRENFVAPDNSDTQIMAKNNMYDFSAIMSVPGWTMRDKTQFWNKIEIITKTMKRKELQSKIAALKRDSKKKKFSEKMVIEKKVSSIQKQLDKLAEKTLNKLALPIEEDYDWEEITHSLDRRHSPAEYRALWKLYLHPSINKGTWSKSEHQLLQKVAHENNLRGWEEIARKMGNNRTGYQCFVYFRTNMNNTFTGKKWTDEEVAYLLRLIDYYKEDDYIPWVKVAALMENRTKIQVYNKYARLLEQRKGRFLLEEDAVILTCADDFGPDYRRISQFLPGRSISQIRCRYQALAKKRVSTTWTVEEDRKLLQLLTNQDNAANYASITKYFPGKDRINIRARYVTLVKWMRRNPNADIVKAPRRGARRLGHGKASDNLNIAVESLKSRIQSETNKRNRKRLNMKSTEEDIEDGIIAALVNETNINEEQTTNEQQVTNTSNNEEVSYNVNDVNLQRILILLRAKLNKQRFDNRQVNNFPKLPKADETCVIKVKSYSKRNKIKSIELNSSPDIWGNYTLKSLEHILPPQYSTITGCRKLMMFVASKQRIDDYPFNISCLGRRNIILREQLDILMERFNTLFLWPLLLSNEPPNLATVFSVDPSLNNLPSHKIILCRDADIFETGNNRETVAVDTDSDADATNCFEINIKSDKYRVSVKHY